MTVTSTADMSIPLSAAPLSVGARAPVFHARDTQGRLVSSTDLAGESVLLTFFPRGWDPAREAQVAFFQHAIRASLGTAHLAVSSEAPWCTVDLADEDPVRFAMLETASEDEELAQRFGVGGCQAAFVIGADGCVRWRHVGPPGALPSMDELMTGLADELASATHDSVAVDPPPRAQHRLSRREFLMATMAIAALAAVHPEPAAAATARRRGERSQNAADASGRTASGTRTVDLDINGSMHRLSLDPRVTLLDALRERIGLSGTKKGCDHGQCGACTVHVDGRRVNACLTLAMQVEGARITTIEGLAQGDTLHPVQAAFIKHDGFQCGYCTPGQIMSAVACIDEGHARTDDDVRIWMSGNICRCGAYNGICDAVREANDIMSRRA